MDKIFACVATRLFWHGDNNAQCFGWSVACRLLVWVKRLALCSLLDVIWFLVGRGPRLENQFLYSSLLGVVFSGNVRVCSHWAGDWCSPLWDSCRTLVGHFCWALFVRDFPQNSHVKVCKTSISRETSSKKSSGNTLRSTHAHTHITRLAKQFRQSSNTRSHANPTVTATFTSTATHDLTIPWGLRGVYWRRF